MLDECLSFVFSNTYLCSLLAPLQLKLQSYPCEKRFVPKFQDTRGSEPRQREWAPAPYALQCLHAISWDSSCDTGTSADYVANQSCCPGWIWRRSSVTDYKHRLGWMLNERFFTHTDGILQLLSPCCYIRFYIRFPHRFLSTSFLEKGISDDSTAKRHGTFLSSSEAEGWHLLVTLNLHINWIVVLHGHYAHTQCFSLHISHFCEI